MNEQIYDHLRTGLDIIRKRTEVIMDCNNFGFVYMHTHTIIAKPRSYRISSIVPRPPYEMCCDRHQSTMMIDEIRTLYKQAYILRHLIVDVDEDDFDAISKKLEAIAAIIDRSAESLNRKITAMQSKNQVTAPLRKW